MTAKGWKRPFDDPIPLPDGRTLITLMDAADYITSLPKKETNLPDWQVAMQALLLVVAERSDDARADRGHEGAEPRLRSRV
jgi:hypothetical protein